MYSDPFFGMRWMLLLLWTLIGGNVASAAEPPSSWIIQASP